MEGQSLPASTILKHFGDGAGWRLVLDALSLVCILGRRMLRRLYVTVSDLNKYKRQRYPSV